MDKDHWARLRQLVQDAARQPADAQQSWLEASCAGDQALFDEALALLGRMRSATAFDERVQDAIGTEAQALEGSERLGETLGAYRLVRKIDEGGMGTVYLAERNDDAYSSQVAVKLLRATRYSDEAARRFASERQILANLNHPYICQLLDGGTSTSGQPYLVMELIDGVDIEQHCNDQRLGIRERIDLFRKVCEAVDYLHRNLVVHRDIKPSNILIQDGSPKLLDFGIAKPLDQKPGDETQVGQRALTPIFASPEQVRGEAITTLTDVYGLGVVLYRLLSGRHPYAPKDQSLRALEDAVCETEPALPSLSVTQTETTEYAPIVPAVQSSEAIPVLRRTLEGDLDNIVLKCLQKDPARRYASPLEIANDLSRYLNFEPVSARPAGRFYRLGKFIRRNRAVVGTASVLLITLAGSVSYYTWQLASERNALDLQVRKTQAVSSFLTNLFGAADPNQSGGETVTAQDLLDQGAEQIREDLEREPEIRAQMLFAIAQAYSRLRDYQSARDLFAEGFELLNEQQRRESPELSAALNGYALVELELGELDRSQSLFEATIARDKAANRTDEQTYAVAQYRLADIERERGDYAAAEERLRPLLDRLRTAPDRDPSSLHGALQVLGYLQRETGRYEEAQETVLESLAAMRKLFPDQPHSAVANALNSLGNNARTLSRYDEALAYYTEALGMWHKLYGTDSLQTGYALANRSGLFTMLGRFEEALVDVELAEPAFLSTLGAEHPNVAILRENKAAILMNLDRTDEALSIYEKTIAQVKGYFGEAHREYALSLYNYAGVLLDLERFEEAQEAASQARAVFATALSEAHPQYAVAQHRLAIALRELGSVAKAEALLLDSVAKLDAAYPEITLDHLNTFEALGRTQRVAGNLGASRDTLARAVTAALDIVQESPLTWRLRLELALTLKALGQTAEAEAVVAQSRSAYETSGIVNRGFERLLQSF